jgi:hypothetical protein
MSRGLYLDLENFGEYLAQQTSVTFQSVDNGSVRFQLNDQSNSEGNRKYISYDREVDDSFKNQEVVAEIVEGDRDQWEELLEPDTTSKTSSLTDGYSVQKIDCNQYIVADKPKENAEDYQ